MCARTAFSAGRLAWMSEISAYFINPLTRFVSSAAAHDDSRIRTRASKFRGCLHRFRDRCARGRPKAESREVFLGCCGEQIELVDSVLPGTLQERFDELTADAGAAICRRDYRRPQQR